MKKAVVIGATGLVGSKLVKLLCQDANFSNITVLSRRNLKIQNTKLKVIICDFTELKEYEDDIVGDYVFSCIGTTIKSAKSKEYFEFVDLQLPLEISRLAFKNGVKKFISISSLGADAKSKNFYLKIKGKMERGIEHSFENSIFVRPSMLLGSRRDFRLLENLAKIPMILASPFLFGKLKKYRPIKAFKVAKAMIKIALSNSDKNIYESNELALLANK